MTIQGDGLLGQLPQADSLIKPGSAGQGQGEGLLN